MVEFAKIIEIRDRKLKQHRKVEKEAIAACNQARTAVQRALQAIEDFAEEIRTLEIELLNELLETKITVLDIEELNRKLAEAEEKAKKLAQRYEEAQAALAEAEVDLETRRRDRTLAQSKLSKIEELDTLMIAERKVESRAQEDAQIDEFVETMRCSGGLI